MFICFSYLLINDFNRISLCVNTPQDPYGPYRIITLSDFVDIVANGVGA